MNWKIYIQALNNFPVADWAVWAYMGFKDKQMSIYFFEDIEEVPVSRYNVVVAYIEDTNKYFQALGLPPKRALNIPTCLAKYAQRKIEYMTMKEFKEDTRLPIFVKPNGRAKEFVAGVITEPSSRGFFFNDIADDCPVLVSEVIDLISEYRGYVCNGNLLGIKHYRGDFRKFVDCSVIDSAIADYEDAPAGYSIDFGLTRDGRTVLIECNDGWSLGNYGLEPSRYANLLLARWIQITKGCK